MISVSALGLACAPVASGASEDPACSGAIVPSLTSAAPNAALNGLFTSYADRSTSQDWSGGDGARSIALPDGRTLWGYGDSLLGPVNPDKTRPGGVGVVPNAFIVQDGDRLSTIYTKSDPPGPAVPVPGQDQKQRWYWLGAGTVAGDMVEIILSQIRRAPDDGGGFGFTGEKQVLARLSLPDLRLVDSTDLPNTVPGLSWSADIQRDGDHTYIYGVRESDGGKSMHIARVNGTSLAGAWEYFTGTGWSATEADTKPVLDDVGAAYGVTKIGRFYTAIMIAPFDPEVYAYFSCSPTGPFTNKTLVYRTPESGEDGTYHDKKIYSYNVDVHDQLGGDGKVVISYSVNKQGGFFDNFKDATVYRPRYADLTFTTP